MTFVDSFEIYYVKQMGRISRFQASLALDSSCYNNEAKNQVKPANVA